MRGRLTVFSGPMFSGKSSALLKSVLWARNGQGRDVLVLKPAFDTRYALSEIVNHDGLRTEAIAIEGFPIPSPLPSPGGMIALDEVQFMENACVDFVNEQIERGVDIVASGLDMDWRGKPFPVTAMLLAMADEAHKMTAHCFVCGRPAGKTFKKAQTGASVEIGATDKYESRCNEHWFAPKE